MSFFCFIKKYIKEPAFIWIFALCLALSCVGIHQFELKNNSKHEEKTYTYYYDRNNQKNNSLVQGVEATKDVMTNATDMKLFAKNAVLLDGESGRVLYEKNGYEKVPMASTTKIMTLIVALENGNLEDMVQISSYAASMPDVQLNVKKGEEYRLKDLLYSLMLESHNDSAVAIAEHIGGSVEGFAKLMNQKAKELGAYDTNFVTPNGLDADNHYTTARDLAMIARYAIQNEEFLKIIQTRSYQFHEQTSGRFFCVNNKDRFLDMYEII